MMIVGALGTIDQHEYVWALCFAGSALLALFLLRRWRRAPYRGRRKVAQLPRRAWNNVSPGELAALCERRIGLTVDAAAPATIAADSSSPCLLALAGDGVWVLEDESRFRRREVGRVLACWDRTGLVAHVQHSRRGERLELSWPRQGALVRGKMPCGPAADLVAGHLTADELTRLKRAIERGTALQIRAVVAELPRPPDLEDALAICLALLDREPETYPRAAAKWASRFAIERRLTLTDAQLTLAALAALPGESARAGAEALIELAERYRLQRVDALLMTWTEKRGK